MRVKTYFCASDIHSFYDIWIIALKNKGFDLNNPDHIIIICGDLFDRGDQSVECWEFIQDMNKQNRLIYVKGNHEELLEECVHSLVKGRNFGRHHISNGTLKTIANIVGVSEYDLLCQVVSPTELEAKMRPVLTFIEEHTSDYREIGDKIFVHGWVPTTCNDEQVMIVHENWRDGDWHRARWENGMEMAHFKLTVPDKTVVCGHWHTSWGHHKYHHDGDEWDGATANFKPYFDDGIIAIDACTVYTHMINVVVFDEEGNIV